MIIEDLKKLGFDNTALIETQKIEFEPSLIDLCKMNSCGNYGKNYTCPPFVGKTEELIQKAKNYKNALVFQKIYKLEDSFDIEGMGEAKRNFKELINAVYNICEKKISNYQILSAGGCSNCEECGAKTGIPCRFPKKAFPSLESYSINVSKLAKNCNMNYINGACTVTYFGAVLY